MAEAKNPKHPSTAVQTTGHAWDGDLQEFNNPLPRWWLWAFYATVVFAVVYWLFYPAWPIGRSYTKGMLNTITYKVGDKEVTTHWNTRALLWKDMQTGEEALKQQKYMEQIAAASYQQIQSDPKMMDFTLSVGKVLFADNCAACHGSGGQGKVGLFPNLVDDDWLWGGSVQDIHTTISEGRHGFMPSFKSTFTDAQLDDVTEYVLSLSGLAQDQDRVAQGKVLFQGQGGGCYYCHGKAGTGLKSQGSANLTDSVWTIADVPDRPDIAGKREAVRQVIRNGVSRQMPTWKGRLNPTEIKLLTVYVHNLSGGAK
jgi:cytochrome c oxidase cbb3-type subunit 3